MSESFIQIHTPSVHEEEPARSFSQCVCSCLGERVRCVKAIIDLDGLPALLNIKHPQKALLVSAIAPRDG